MDQIQPSRVTPGLNVYAFFAKRKFPKSYLGKILLVAFLGTHIPLLALIFYAIGAADLESAVRTRILLVALVATLVGAISTLMALHRLLAPVMLAALSLRAYLEHSRVPELPTHYTDDAGRLLADTQLAISKIDESIYHLKNYDPLTALPNRAYFQDRLEQSIVRARRDKKSLAIMLLDIDGFSALNNSLGQEHGDWLLSQIGQRLSTCVRETDVLSRVGSDEFAVLHSDFNSIDDAISHSQRIMDTISEPLVADGKSTYLTASIGIVVYPSDENGSEKLMNNADVALRMAKDQGRNTRRFYSSDMNERLRRRLDLERDLRGALERGELELYYQPQIDVRTGTFSAAEALLRWNHPQRGLVSPAEFIPVAEATGLILPIGEWVMRTACTQNVLWQAEGYPALRVAVNLSAPQFQGPKLTDLVAEVLRDTRCDPTRLELEITEGLVMEDVQKAIRVLEDLHSLNITLALDDFGTGYSSLSYLKRFPLDYLKIDQSFISGVPTDANDTAITRSIIGLAQGLQLGVIAEGVETIKQVDYLSENGCTILQGYHFSRPVPAKQFEKLWEPSVFATTASS